MNRTERLYALVEELRAHAPRLVRAAELAARFEVGTRTVERDLLALQEAGVPIWAQRGPRGGYSLNVDTTLPPLNLTPAEAEAIAIALAASTLPFAEAGRSALLKLASAMGSAPKRATAERLRRIRVVPRSSAATNRTADIVQRALAASVALRITYRDAQERDSERVIEPAGIVGTQHGWYLAAFCRLRQGPRLFRLDRITAAQLNGEPITPPPLDVILRDVPMEFVEPELL